MIWKNNNLLHIISQSVDIDNEIKNKFISFIELIKNNTDNDIFISLLNQQNNYGNIFLFDLIGNNKYKLKIMILQKYFSFLIYL